MLAQILTAPHWERLSRSKPLLQFGSWFLTHLSSAPSAVVCTRYAYSRMDAALPFWEMIMENEYAVGFAQPY